MSTTSIILKTDKRGHVRMPTERREELLAEYDRSGLSLARFTELAGVRYSTFATWLQHRRIKTGAASQDKEKDKEKKKDRPKPVQFAEALVDGTLPPAPVLAWALKVSLPGARRWSLRKPRTSRLQCSFSTHCRSRGHAELHRQFESLCGAGALRHAQGL